MNTRIATHWRADDCGWEAGDGRRNVSANWSVLHIIAESDLFCDLLEFTSSRSLTVTSHGLSPTELIIIVRISEAELAVAVAALNETNVSHASMWSSLIILSSARRPPISSFAHWHIGVVVRKKARRVRDFTFSRPGRCRNPKAVTGNESVPPFASVYRNGKPY